MVGDIRTEAGTTALVADVRRTVDRVDIVINNYGVPEGSDWESSDTASWHGSYDVNVVTAVRVTQAFLPDMRAAGWGRVVFVVDGRRHPPGRPHPRVLRGEGRAAVDRGEPGQAPGGHRHHGELRESRASSRRPRSSSGSPSGPGATGWAPTGRASSG